MNEPIDNPDLFKWRVIDEQITCQLPVDKINDGCWVNVWIKGLIDSDEQGGKGQLYEFERTLCIKLKKVKDYGIRLGIFKANTLAQINSIVSSGRFKKYDFKRGPVYYVFESWKPLNVPEDQ